MKMRILGALLAISALQAAPANAQQTPPDDPRVIAVRQAIDQLDDLAQRPPCNQTPETTRWLNAGTPDQGLANPLISAHRGAITLAPENTLQSYEYAFAFGVDFVEVDVQQTKDGKFVALHDDTVDRTTNGTGSITSFTYDEVRKLNAADYEPWKGGQYDPAQVASIEEILQLAKRGGGALELDIKGSVTEEGKLAELVQSYGLAEASIWNSSDPRILIAAPGARIIYNRDTWEPPYLMYEIAKVAPVFGSRRDEYTPESIVAIHDGCGVAMPHAYDSGPEQEVAEFQKAREMGADGVQTNQPELIVAAAGIPAPSKLVVDVGNVCLVNRDNGLGFATRPIAIDGAAVRVGRGGCTALPAGAKRIVFAGDGAVQASNLTLSAVGGTVPATLALSLGAPASFGAFSPGVTKDYSASTIANVVSTAGDAALTFSDPGHLTNGTFALAQPLVVELSKATWSAPVSNDPVTIAFKQHVDATDALRTGTYTKTLTFTLSTTAP
ncbi:glycerophosphodiester phosphodiesterase family protein [Solirubrobacter ginsenosidimutans]|uniref:Glycerophosphodiester phosphodiesterase family protein n=1 Tax=Solirubrobacter ginsenosidimutans TaxID=490573 RepID=A0A9X3MV97_9ACTN|nr:glycerophosphodiester phosphodiesterase family protein [Solirubrobacter ginsenosidimutans]MDA0163369.1 glycerophosphodiester phosphodiesterase family protein [Solirubrobacter ginsenosidimutans]